MSNLNAAIATAIANRRAQDVEGKGGYDALNENNVKKSEKYLAFFAGAAFAEIAEKAKLNIGFIDGSNGAARLDCYACERLMRFVGMIGAGISAVEKESDQLRYAVTLMQTLRSAVAIDKKLRITKADALATATKGMNKETANGYADGYIGEHVSVASRIMATGTAKRQSIMTLRAFECLGMVEKIDERAAGGAVTFAALPNASFYRRANAVFAKNAAQAAGLAETQEAQA